MQMVSPTRRFAHVNMPLYWQCDPKTEEVSYVRDLFEGDLLEFRLLYSGRVLGANKKNTRPEAKHALRREFHQQLRQLWASNKNLDEFARHHCAPWFNKYPDQRTVASNSWTNDQFRQIGIESISDNWQRGAFKFVPLVTEDGLAPPKQVVLSFCQSAVDCDVEDEVIIARARQDPLQVLSHTERVIVDVFRDYGPILSLAALEDHCVKRGIKRTTSSLYAGRLAIMARYAPGVLRSSGCVVLGG
jgi:hypothetical protein